MLVSRVRSGICTRGRLSDRALCRPAAGFPPTCSLFSSRKLVNTFANLCGNLYTRDLSIVSYAVLQAGHTRKSMDLRWLLQIWPTVGRCESQFSRPQFLPHIDSWVYRVYYAAGYCSFGRQRVQDLLWNLPMRRHCLQVIILSSIRVIIPGTRFYTQWDHKSNVQSL